MSKTSQIAGSTVTAWLWRSSAVLFMIWGIVHLIGGIATIAQLASGKAAAAVHAITPKSERSLIEIDYPEAIVAILSQHGFNLLWAGLVVMITAVFVWRRNTTLLGLAAIVAACFDLGYFVFIDLGGFAAFPGPQMTYICAAAIILGFVARQRGSGSTAD